MEKMKLIELKGESISGLPLYLRKIYFNELSSLNEEMKLIKYNHSIQSSKMRDAFPSRQISKTVNRKIFKNENEK
jgi:hypothetical protein